MSMETPIIKVGGTTRILAGVAISQDKMLELAMLQLINKKDSIYVDSQGETKW